MGEELDGVNEFPMQVVIEAADTAIAALATKGVSSTGPAQRATVVESKPELWEKSQPDTFAAALVLCVVAIGLMVVLLATWLILKLVAAL